MLHLKEGSKDGIANYIIYRNIGLFVAGFIGAFLAFWRSKSLSRQATVAEQGHITERIIRASEQLGSPEVHVRIGAIYTLWRTATDTNLEADKSMILDMLCAYIRSPTENHANKNSLSLKDNYGIIRKKNTEEKIRDDVQICLNLLCKKIVELDLSSPYHCNLKNSFLKNSDLREADLTKADLTGAKLTGAKLPGADLTGAKLGDAYLTGAKLGDAYLTGADLRKADLREADLMWADLRWADLTGADLREAYLREAYLTGADLRWADLTGAKLTGADLTKADLTGADLTGAKLGDAYLRGAYLTQADLTGADLTCADLTGADLTGADLTEADLSWAKVGGANLMEANLTEADLGGANFLMTNLWTIPKINKEFNTVTAVKINTTQRNILTKCLQLRDKNKTS